MWNRKELFYQNRVLTVKHIFIFCESLSSESTKLIKWRLFLEHRWLLALQPQVWTQLRPNERKYIDMRPPGLSTAWTGKIFYENLKGFRKSTSDLLRWKLGSHPSPGLIEIIEPGTLGSCNFFLQSIPIWYRYDLANANFGIGYSM